MKWPPLVERNKENRKVKREERKFMEEGRKCGKEK
jgi:hypothetical protein